MIPENVKKAMFRQELKLKAQRREEIYKRWLAGETQTAIAKSLGVTAPCVWQIIQKLKSTNEQSERTATR